MSNADPRKVEGYYFRKLEDLLTEVGQYRLEYELEPSVPGRDLLKISTLIHVSPGPAKYFKITACPSCQHLAYRVSSLGFLAVHRHVLLPVCAGK